MSLHRRPKPFAAIARRDERLFRSLAAVKPRRVDAVLPALSNVADHSLLWIGVAAAMRAFGGRRTKRAAARGLASVAATSLVANQVLKRLHRRARPDGALVALERRSKRMPTSSSFPSGHSASAAAFATAVAVENLPLGAALGVLAAGVGLSRVSTGAHYPSDVIAGFATGAAVALIGAHVVPPVRPVLQAGDRPTQVETAALPDGDGLTVIVNKGSGVDKSPITDEIRAALPKAQIRTLGEDEDLLELAERALDGGAKAIGVSGGDGTVVAVASVAMRRGAPLAVFPGGTFNHFAKDARVAEVDDTARAVQEGTASRVDVATLNDEIFLNTASLGTYPEFVTERESLQPHYGKRLAAVIAAWRLLRARPQTHLVIDGEPVAALLFFVGNGQYEPRDFAPAMRPRLDDGVLDVRLIVADRRALTARLLWAVLTGTLEQSSLYRRKTVSSLDVRIGEPEVLIARDGEVDPPSDHVRFGVRERALLVYQPADPAL